MCTYHKIIKLSIVILLAILASGFLFPSAVLASDFTTNSILKFDSSKETLTTLFASKEDISFCFSANTTSTKVIENNRVVPFIGPIMKKSGGKETETIIVSTLAKKNIAEEYAVIVPEKDQDNLAEKICAAAGITNLPCWQDLKIMREKESYGGKVMIGDGGKSRGWYHIQVKMHGISDACALDFECSTRWTVNNLVANGYSVNRFYAISRHNGSGPAAQRYAKNVIFLSEKLNK